MLILPKRRKLITRRSFLAGIALIAAPAIIRPASAQLSMSGVGGGFGAAVGAATTWNPTGLPAGYSLANVNRDLSMDGSGGGAYNWVLSTTSKTDADGKIYIEILHVLLPNDGLQYVGFTNAAITEAGVVKPQGISAGFEAGTTITFNNTAGGGSAAQGQTTAYAFDFANGRAYVGFNGTFTSQDPTLSPAGGPIFEWTPDSTPYFIMTALWNAQAGATSRICASAAQQAHSPPAGYSPWDV